MKVFGLTGGVASGKTEAARRFQENDIPVLNADAIGHEVIGPGGAAEQLVMNTFGQGIVQCGKINRDQLGALVFSDAAAREQLNKLVHPIILDTIQERVSSERDKGARLVLVEAALFGEAGVDVSWMDGMILVLCQRDIRLHRLQRLRGLSREAADQRIAAQAAPESKLALADFVIYNDKGLGELYMQVDAVAQRLYALSV